MVNEVISYLIPSKPLLMINDKQPMFIDATVGGGGHAQALLEKVKHGIVIGLDCDVEAIEHTKSLMKKYNNFYLFQSLYIDDLTLYKPIQLYYYPYNYPLLHYLRLYK